MTPLDGNTPAYAGKTSSAFSVRFPAAETPPLTRGRLSRNSIGTEVSRKHPRLRGEDLSRREVLVDSEETPPLTRGRLQPAAILLLPCGNTPAYAGKT